MESLLYTDVNAGYWMLFLRFSYLHSMLSRTSPPLRIRVDRLTPRVEYAFATVLGEFLGVGHTLHVAEAEVDLQYVARPLPGLPSLPVDGLLYASGIVAAVYQPQAHPTDLLAEDILGLVFRRISQYDDYLAPQRDAHGRYVGQTPSLALHAALRHLKAALQRAFPALHFPVRPFSWELTLDIDQPWKHRHKPLPVQIGGALKSLLGGRLREVGERFRSIVQGHDPYDTLARVQQLCDPAATSVFFLAGRGHALDSRYDLGMPAYQAYLRRWQAAGFQIGLHPSYLSSEEPDRFAAERDLVAQVCGPVTRSRQHYLRYALPSTFRALHAAGITHDYTLCGHEELGSRTGIALPYDWYDLAAEAPTRLRLVPAVAMDRTLQQYLALSPAAAFGRVSALIDTLRAEGGHFVLILHNETFSDAGEWAGWLRWIQATLSHLRQDGSPSPRT
jgi:hypothetical protein